VGASRPHPDAEGTHASIWLLAGGYFLAYAPYAALTRSLTNGALGPSLSGLSILPISTGTSLLGMVVFLSIKRWWVLAHHSVVFGVRVPHPTKTTLVSGLATAAVIATTTLSYTLEGTSILVMMLFMRGGVLVLAPLVDLLTGRHVRWQSWVALGLSGLALLLGVGGGETHVDALGGLVIGVYLFGYFLRLRLMSAAGKIEAADARRFFVEEQMVATPAVVAFLGAVAIVGAAPWMLEVRGGFTTPPPGLTTGLVVLVGLLSQATGIFGALVLLDPRENAFCVPVNRASSVLAGVVASLALAALGAGGAVPARELAGAGLLVAAIVLLATSRGPVQPARR
jgi:hypothetical protein